MPSLPIVGTSYEFDDCPAYYLRTAGMGLPASHLLEDMGHPAMMVGEWAFEVETGSRNIETLSPKARELVHLHLRERDSRERKLSEMRKENRGKH